MVELVSGDILIECKSKTYNEAYKLVKNYVGATGAKFGVIPTWSFTLQTQELIPCGQRVKTI